MERLDMFQRALRLAIKKRYAEGRPNLIKKDMEKLSARFNIGIKNADTERKAIENELRGKWVAKNSIPSAVLSAAPELRNANEIMANFQKAMYARAEGAVDTAVQNAVEKGLKKGVKAVDLARLVNREFGKGKAYSKTIVRTARLAKIRVDSLVLAVKQGYEYYELDGPNSDRYFFKKYNGRVFTIAEIIKLENDNKLSPLVYCCGFNCRHTWRAVPKAEALRRRGEN